MRDLVDATKAELEEVQRQEANSETWGKAKWGCKWNPRRESISQVSALLTQIIFIVMAFPLLGAAVLIGDHFAGPKVDELRARGDELQRNYDEMVRQEGEDQAQLVAARSMSQPQLFDLRLHTLDISRS
jgi:hypothetical protein